MIRFLTSAMSSPWQLMVEVIYHTMGFRFEKGKPDFGGSFGGHLEYDVIKKRPTHVECF